MTSPGKAPGSKKRSQDTPTPQEIEEFTTAVLADRIAWRASRAFLVMVLADPQSSALDLTLRTRINAFLARHP